MKAVWLSSTYYLDPRIIDLSEGAECLFNRSIAYCGAAETSGFIPKNALKTLGIHAINRKKSELVSSGLWLEIEGGFRLAGWDNWQGSGDDLLKRRKSDRERQAKRRALSRDTSRDVTPPEESRGEKKESGETRVRAHTTRKKLTEIPDDWKPNDAHRAKAESRGVDLDHEAEQMRTWARGKAERKASWDQAFHHWLGNARPTWKRAGTPLPSTPDAVTEWLRGMHRAGTAKPVTDRSGLGYYPPDNRCDTAAEYREVVREDVRRWITEDHDEIIRRIVARESVAA